MSTVYSVKTKHKDLMPYGDIVWVNELSALSARRLLGILRSYPIKQLKGRD